MLGLSGKNTKKGKKWKEKKMKIIGLGQLFVDCNLLIEPDFLTRYKLPKDGAVLCDGHEKALVELSGREMLINSRVGHFLTKNRTNSNGTYIPKLLITNL